MLRVALECLGSNQGTRCADVLAGYVVKLSMVCTRHDIDFFILKQEPHLTENSMVHNKFNSSFEYLHVVSHVISYFSLQ